MVRARANASAALCKAMYHGAERMSEGRRGEVREVRAGERAVEYLTAVLRHLASKDPAATVSKALPFLACSTA